MLVSIILDTVSAVDIKYLKLLKTISQIILKICTKYNSCLAWQSWRHDVITSSFHDMVDKRFSKSRSNFDSAITTGLDHIAVLRDSIENKTSNEIIILIWKYVIELWYVVILSHELKDLSLNWNIPIDV